MRPGNMVRPISFFMTAGQVSDYTGVAALLDGLPKADWLLGDRGYDADWFRDALEEKGITPCIPGRKSRTKPVKYDKRRYKSRNRIEIMFSRLKDWRRFATRYHRCPTVFLSAVALAATVLCWLWVLSLAQGTRRLGRESLSSERCVWHYIRLIRLRSHLAKVASSMVPAASSTKAMVRDTSSASSSYPLMTRNVSHKISATRLLPSTNGWLRMMPQAWAAARSATSGLP